MGGWGDEEMGRWGEHFEQAPTFISNSVLTEKELTEILPIPQSVTFTAQKSISGLIAKIHLSELKPFPSNL
ncbi:MAG: hypothetical protein F6K16_04490 [Symploca sp. SIO2B6]|nr:hypothetical protein [Symploca sp. SIO2B6]